MNTRVTYNLLTRQKNYFMEKIMTNRYMSHGLHLYLKNFKFFIIIRHIMTIILDTKKSNFGTQYWLWFHIWYIMTLYYKMRLILLQNAADIL